MAAGSPRMHRRKVDIDDLGLTRLPVDDLIARQFRQGLHTPNPPGCRRTDQVADAHARLQRILSRHLDPAIDADHRGGFADAGLHSQVIQQRLDDAVAPGLQVKHGDFIARHQGAHSPQSPDGRAPLPNRPTVPRYAGRAAVRV